MMVYTMMAQLNDGHRERLNQSEFVGEGIHTINDAIEAAKDAMQYADGIEYIDLYLDGYGYIGFVDDCGEFSRDCDCDIDLD